MLSDEESQKEKVLLDQPYLIIRFSIECLTLSVPVRGAGYSSEPAARRQAGQPASQQYGLPPYDRSNKSVLLFLLRGQNKFWFLERVRVRIKSKRMPKQRLKEPPEDNAFGVDIGRNES